MKINPNSQNTTQPNYKQSFKALPVAKIRLRNMPAADEFTLYSVGKNDLPFLNELLESLNLEKMYPNIPDKKDFDRWKDMLYGAITNIKFGSDGLLSARKSTPCSVMSYNDINNGTGIYLDHQAAWPIEPNQGTKCAGKSIMRHVFEKAVNEHKNFAMGVPERMSPRGKTSRDYLQELGFIENIKNATIEMHANEKSNKFSDAIKKLDEIMDYQKIDNAAEVDLHTVLNLDLLK